MPDHLYKPVGLCIYCGTAELPPGVARFGDEHIIPLGFGGNLVLQEASCRKCERLINQQIETPILRHEWGPFRDKYKLPTRDKRGRAKRTHLTAPTVDGSEMTIPLSDHSTPVPLYRFMPPRILSGVARATKLDMHWTMSILGNTERETAMQAKFPKWNKTHKFKSRPHIFAKLMAKIGYSYAVAEWGNPGATFTPLVTDLILGRTNDYPYVVGGWLESPPPAAVNSHILELKVMGTGLMTHVYLIVDIRLFPTYGTPAYRVVVGEIRYNNPEHVRTFDQYRLDGKIVEGPLLIGERAPVSPTGV